jgi:hypothetical protein
MLSAAALLAVGLAVSSAQAPAQAPQPTPSTESTRALDRPFPRLLVNLAEDVRALPSANTWAALGIGGGSALLLHPADDNLSSWAGDRTNSRYTSFGRVAGDGWTQGAIALGTYVAGLAARHQPTVHLGSDLIRGQFLTGLITHGLKLGIGRHRPSGSGHSFPSGHTSAAFLTAAVIGEHYGWGAGLPAYGLAGFIGWTRVRDDTHWLTDVLAGATLGTIVGRAVASQHRTRDWAVSVAPTVGGATVMVMKVPQRR